MEGNSFWGQIAAIYLFDEPLTMSQIQAIYELSPNYSAQFLTDDIESSPKQFDATLKSKLCLNYNSKASKDTECVDLAQRFTKATATLYKVYKCVTQKMKNVVQSQGGMKVLFPLILQLDYKYDIPDTHLSVLTLRLFRVLLEQNSRNQDDMLNR